MPTPKPAPWSRKARSCRRNTTRPLPGRAPEGEVIKSEIREEALKARNVILSQGRDAATRKIQEIREEVQKEMEAARRVASTNADALAQQMAEKVLGRKLT